MVRKVFGFGGILLVILWVVMLVMVVSVEVEKVMNFIVLMVGEVFVVYVEWFVLCLDFVFVVFCFEVGELRWEL